MASLGIESPMLATGTQAWALAMEASKALPRRRPRPAPPHRNPPVAQTKTGRCRTSAVDRRTTRHVGYRISRSGRARGECTFGGGRRHAAMRKTRPRGIEAVSGDVMFTLVACNPVRIPKRLAA